jgi:F-type H+-transporting ATPase subunit gamma
MAQSLQSLKKGLKSIKNTQKITRTMQMISSSKLQKSLKTLATIRNYSKKILTVFNSIDSGNEFVSHPLTGNQSTETTPVKTLVLVISSDKGLCGSYNSKIISYIKNNFEREVTDFIFLGKKAIAISRIFENSLSLALYPNSSKVISSSSIKDPVDQIIQLYIAGEYLAVKVVYTDYISSFNQEVKVTNLLPLELTTLTTAEEEETEVIKSKIEGEVADILNFILPMVVETQVYQCWIESQASEHSSRITAMKNATDTASDFIQAISLKLNKTRQASITQEIAQIVNGMTSTN